jgi:hypothetical protein
MNKSTKHFLIKLFAFMSVGFITGWIFSLAGHSIKAALWLSIGFGLFYLHMRWLRNLNKTDGDIKIKSLI